MEDEDEDFLKYVLGVSYRETNFAALLGLEEISPYFEYGGEIVFEPQLATNFIINSKNSRPMRNSVNLKIDFRQNNEFTYIFGITHNISTNDNLVMGLVEYKYNDNLKFQLERRQFSGSDNTQFGRWKENDFIGLNIQYKF